MCVKANQKRLYRWIEQQSQVAQQCEVYQHSEQRHGRTITWRVAVFDDLGDFACEWAGLKRCIWVQRSGIRAGQAFAEQQSYISSAALTAEQFHHLIRAHWRIENQLHWVKDVVFNEDDAPYRTPFAAANWSVIRNVFITLARSLGFTSLATAKRKLANNLSQVFPLLQ